MYRYVICLHMVHINVGWISFLHTSLKLSLHLKGNSCMIYIVANRTGFWPWTESKPELYCKNFIISTELNWSYTISKCKSDFALRNFTNCSIYFTRYSCKGFASGCLRCVKHSSWTHNKYPSTSHIHSKFIDKDILDNYFVTCLFSLLIIKPTQLC